ncbi:MAG: hypothetical protein F4Y94_07925, partial [Chloroflexi bacterium]|nr:hypothetical protein [Chloroflexota bacterium]
MRTRLLRVAAALVFVAAVASVAVPLSSPRASAQTPAVSVSISASPASPLVGQPVTLSASISNAPAGGSPSYAWELSNGGGWIPWPGSATFSFLAGKPESWSFRVTVGYGAGVSATSAPLTVTWTNPTPEPEPEPE